MKNFNSLVNLINKLTSEELKSLLKFLKYYNEKNNNSKSYELIRLILKEKDYSALNFQKKLYGDPNFYAFNKLVDRLKVKTLEVVLFDSNISKNYYPERVKVLFDLKKKLIQCDVLSLKGLRDDGDNLCKKIINKAEKYELYDIIMNALIMRQRFINVRKKQNEVLSIQKGIEIAEAKYKSIIHSQFIYNSIINKLNTSTDTTNFKNDLVETIDKLNYYYNLYKSEIIGYYLFFLKSELYQIENNFKMAEKCFTKINYFLKKKSIYSENRMGSTLLNFANIKIHLNKFDDAMKNAVDARKYFPNNLYNKALVEEYLFYSNFYKGDILASESIIKKLINLQEENISSFNINKWNYFYSAVLFKKNKYLECINQLDNIIEIDKDKEGWNINKRLLLIISRIELGQYESVDLQVVNLEKFIKRSMKKRDIRIRYIYILRILIKLINENYNFAEVFKSRHRYFELLSSDEVDLKWKIKSPELIIFDHWFKSKLSNIKQ